MDSPRNGIIAVMVLLTAVFAVMYGMRQCTPQQQRIELPLDLARIIPETWEPQDKQLPTVDIDGDGEQEWLVIYRYDSAQEERGPIGGVIYDAQVDISPHQLGVAIPYRSAFLVPYKLLPDTHPGKGQGYLADKRVGEPEQVDTDGDGKADELIIRGYGHDPAITRLSIFRWAGRDEGYTVEHFQGSGGITTVDKNRNGVIEEIIVRRRQYERSQQCREQTYTRQGDGTYEPSSPSLTFCYETPDHPFYPEGVVLTFLLSPQRRRQAEMFKPDSERGLMTAKGRQEAKALDLHHVKSFRVLEFTYPGVALPFGEEGVAVADELRGMEQVEIWTDVVVDGEQRTYRWQVINTSSQKVNEDTIWRINGASRG